MYGMQLVFFYFLAAKLLEFTEFAVAFIICLGETYVWVEEFLHYLCKMLQEILLECADIHDGLRFATFNLEEEGGIIVFFMRLAYVEKRRLDSTVVKMVADGKGIEDGLEVIAAILLLMTEDVLHINRLARFSSSLVVNDDIAV